MEQQSVRTREALEADVSFIFNSWLKSNRQSDFWTDVGNPIYYTCHHQLIEKLLKRCKTIIACEANDPSSILGWICYDRLDNNFQSDPKGTLVIHYVYVKHTFRNLGLAKLLAAETGHDFSQASIYSHNTKPAKRIAEKHNMLFHPYVLMHYNK